MTWLVAELLVTRAPTREANSPAAILDDWTEVRLLVALSISVSRVCHGDPVQPRRRHQTLTVVQRAHPVAVELEQGANTLGNVPLRRCQEVAHAVHPVAGAA